MSSVVKLRTNSGGADEIEDEQDIRHEGTEFGERVGPPGTIVERDASKAQQGTDDTHQGTTSNETRGDEVTLLATGLVNGLVLRTGGTYQLMAPPMTRGTFSSMGMNIPRAKARAGTLHSVSTTAMTAPRA